MTEGRAVGCAPMSLSLNTLRARCRAEQGLPGRRAHPSAASPPPGSDMRTPVVVLAGTFALLACAGGTVYVPAPAPVSTSAQKPAPRPVATAPAPRPLPAPMPPVGVTIVRADEGRLQVSTNQPAYLVV